MRRIPARVGLPSARLIETGEHVAHPVHGRPVRGVEELAGMLRAHPEVGGEPLDRCRRLGQLAGTLDRAPLAWRRASWRAASRLLPVGNEAEGAQEV